MNNEYLTPVNLRREIYDILNIHTDAEIINIYNHSKIYKIVSPSTDKIYIGSTTQTLAQRLGKHIKIYKYYTNNNSYYTSSYEIIKLGDYSIQLIEQCNFNNKEQLRQREGYYIKLYNDICVNNRIAGRTKTEYKTDNKNRLIIRDKQYYIDNKEIILEKTKQYRNANKQVLAEKKKQYSITNKCNIAEKKKKTIQCECGLILTKSSIKGHTQTPKHFTNINMIYLNELTTL